MTSSQTDTSDPITLKEGWYYGNLHDIFPRFAAAVHTKLPIEECYFDFYRTAEWKGAVRQGNETVIISYGLTSDSIVEVMGLAIDGTENSVRWRNVVFSFDDDVQSRLDSFDPKEPWKGSGVKTTENVKNVCGDGMPGLESVLKSWMAEVKSRDSSQQDAGNDALLHHFEGEKESTATERVRPPTRSSVPLDA